MTRKIWMLIALAVALAAISLYLNKDWFAKDNIQIYHRSRPGDAASFRRRNTDNSPVALIVFGFDRKVKLTLLKVIPVSDIQTNQHPQPIWHLVSDSNSVPIKGFTYGMHIPGMHPAIKGAQPDPLAPNEKYRLFIETASQKAEHDFVPAPRTQ